MKFALFLTLFMPTTETEGQNHVFILDSGMTGIACTALLEEIAPAYDLLGEGWLSCEQDHAAPFKVADEKSGKVAS